MDNWCGEGACMSERTRQARAYGLCKGYRNKTGEWGEAKLNCTRNTYLANAESYLEGIP